MDHGPSPPVPYKVPSGVVPPRIPSRSSKPKLISRDARQLERTILVKNIPLSLNESGVRLIFEMPGGIKRVRFFPKGKSKSALIEYAERESIQGRYVDNFVEIDGMNLHVEPAKITIDAASYRKQKNNDDLLRRGRVNAAITSVEGEVGEKDDKDLSWRRGPRNPFLSSGGSKSDRERRLEEELSVANHRITALEARNNELLSQIADLSQEVALLRNDAGVGSSSTLEDGTTSKTGGSDGTSIDGGVTLSDEKLEETRRLALMLNAVDRWKDFSRKKRAELLEQEALEAMMEEERKRQEEEANREYLCSICFCDYKIDEIYILDVCCHRFCRNCITRHLEIRIKEGDLTHLTCPDVDCEQEISYHEIRGLVDKETFDKYEEFNLNRALGKMEDLRWCPRRGCGNAMIGDPGNPLMRCFNPTCKFTFCFNCKVEWHADITCAQYQEWKRAEADGTNRFREWVRNHAKACPSCSSPIEKNGGCNHMTCRNCGHEFCWLCMARYTPSHFRDSSCQQFT